MSTTFVKKRKITPEEMQALRAQGYSYAKIADVSGISRQMVHCLIGKTDIGKVRPITEKQCVYPSLRKWMNDNHISRMELARRVYGNTGGRNYQRVNDFITARSGIRTLHKPFLDKLLEITGLTYEQLFAKN